MSAVGKKRIALGIWTVIILVVFLTYLAMRTSLFSDMAGNRIAVEDGVIDPEIKGDNLKYEVSEEESWIFRIIDLMVAIATPLAIYAGKKQIDKWSDQADHSNPMI